MFSGALTLTDLNDFLTPSQACIKPVEEVKPDALSKAPGAASTEIQVDVNGTYYEVTKNDASATASTSTGARRKLEQAQINLNDCLACSGCITSAESVLITMQSHTEVLDALETNPASGPTRKVPVVSISPQSIASLAASLSSSSSSLVPMHSVLRRIRAFCKSKLGFEHVFDTTFARHVALAEHAREFDERKRGVEGAGRLPMLASACPGWVCYAEKTHAEMLPFISRSKSPQQVMGTLVKEWMGEKWGKTPDLIYHVSVMPCYDKKLEASRSDFFNDVHSTRDVDCVITTGELELLMREKEWDLSQPISGEEDHAPASADLSAEELLIPELLVHPGTTAGSYMQSLIDALSAVESPGSVSLSTKTMRTADYEEHTLTRDDGTAIFRGAKCYGFRNLQNVVRKIGRDTGVQTSRGAAGRLTTRGGGRRAGVGASAAAVQERGYDYVEVFACPGACINGGGQLRPPAETTTPDAEGFVRDWAADGVAPTVVMPPASDGTQSQGYASKWGDREWTARVEAIYWDGLPTPPPSPPLSSACLAPWTHPRAMLADRLAVQIARDLCNPVVPIEAWTDTMDAEAEKRRHALFRTGYRAVESEVLGIAVKW